MTASRVFRGVIVFQMLITCHCASQAQTVVFGRIADESGVGIPYANVLLLDSARQSIMSYNSADDEGGYRIAIQLPGHYAVTFSAMGFLEKNIPLSFSSDSSFRVNITLQEKTLHLHEVVIEASQPVTQKGDTIVFDAKSFAEGNEDVVEDLLRKIPGLNVSEDGTIRIGQQEVEKVMVEGDDFFEKGYKMLTKNMPAQPIRQVELLQHYSHNPLLKGIEESDKVALNLKLEEDAKNQWFANISAGYGIQDRHTVTANVFNFSTKDKYYLLAHSNDIGYNAAGDVEQVTRSGDGVITDIEEDASTGQLINLTKVNLDFHEQRTNINDDRLISANAILHPTKTFHVKAVVFGLRNSRSFFDDAIESVRATGISFVNTETNRWNNLSNEGLGKLELTADTRPNQLLKTVTTFYGARSSTQNTLNFNATTSGEELDTRYEKFDQQAVLTTRLRDDLLWQLGARYISEMIPQNFTVNRFLLSELFPDTDVGTGVRQQSTMRRNSGGIEGELVKKTSDDALLTLKAGSLARENRLQSQFSIKGESNETIAEPPEYENNAHYFTSDTYVDCAYSKPLGKWNIAGKIEFHQLFNSLDDDFRRTQRLAFVNPSVSANWQANAKNKFVANYALNKQNTTLPDLFRGWVATGFRSFHRGTGYLNQLDVSSLFVMWQRGSFMDNSVLNVMALYNRGHDFLSSTTLLSQNYLLSETTPMKGRDILSVSGTMDQSIPFLLSNLKLSLSYSKTKYSNVINDIRRIIHSDGYTAGVELRSGLVNRIHYHVGSEWSRHMVRSGVRNSYLNHNMFVDLTIKLSGKSLFQVQGERYVFGSTGTDGTYYFVDAEWRHKVIPNKLTLSVIGKNLTNTDRFTTASVTDISFLSTEYALLPRYVLAKAEYRL